MRNGRPYAIKIAPAAVIAFAALAVGYGLGEQSDELAEAYEQCKQAVFDAMNHFDELAIVERANPYRKDGR